MTNAQRNGSTGRLYMAIEVSNKTWRLAMTDLTGERQVTVGAWDSVHWETSDIRLPTWQELVERLPAWRV